MAEYHDNVIDFRTRKKVEIQPDLTDNDTTEQPRFLDKLLRDLSTQSKQFQDLVVIVTEKSNPNAPVVYSSEITTDTMDFFSIKLLRTAMEWDGEEFDIDNDEEDTP